MHGDAQGREWRAGLPELPIERVDRPAKASRRDAPRGQAAERFDGDQIGEAEKALAPARARMHQSKARPIVQLLARGAGHALNFAASESLVQVASPFSECVCFAQE